MAGASSLRNSNHEPSLLWVPLGSGPKGGDRPRSMLRLEGLKGEWGSSELGQGCGEGCPKPPAPSLSSVSPPTRDASIVVTTSGDHQAKVFCVQRPDR